MGLVKLPHLNIFGYISICINSFKIRSMKKLVLCVCVYLITAFSFKSVSAGEVLSSVNESSVENYIFNIYNQIDFGKNDHLSFEVFENAYHGYINLRNAGKLNTAKEILTVCDFTRSSTANRLWIIDLKQKKILLNTYVAHGQGSGDEYATAFSNNNESHQSSLGFYVTGETYVGEHGVSLHLTGMDNGFNDAAYDRGIVVHGADYVCGRYVAANQKLGRSWGCPAVPARLSGNIINTIKDGTCLFIYYPQKNYMKTAYWLNKKIDRLPDNNNAFSGIRMPAYTSAPAKMDTLVEYITNGKIDSTKTLSSHQGQ
jgi:hypothetical protein